MKLQNKKVTTVLLLLIAAIFLFVLVYNSDIEVFKLDPSRIDKLERIRKKLVGIKLAKIDSLLVGNSVVKSQTLIIAYYNSNDCLSCIKKLKNTIAIIDSTYSAIPLYLISNDADNINLLADYSITDPFIVDHEDKLPKWINYSYSPVLLLLNKEHEIQELYHVTSPLYKKGKSRFFEYLKASLAR